MITPSEPVLQSCCLDSAERVVTAGCWPAPAVGDAPADSVAARLARIRDPRVWLVRNERAKGGAGARNHGISLARGQWVCLIDSDDLWDVRMLEHLAAGIERAGPQVGVVYGSDHSIDMDTGEVKRRRVATRSGPAYPHMLERHFYHHCAAATRRVALESVGGYDEELGGMEDTDLQHRLTERWDVLAVPEAISYYRLGRSDQVTRDYSDRAAKMLRFLAKHGAVLRTMPRSHVKIAGVVMVTCLKGGRWVDACRLWGRVVRWRAAARTTPAPAIDAVRGAMAVGAQGGGQVSNGVHKRTAEPG